MRLAVHKILYKQFFANKNNTTSEQWKGSRVSFISVLMYEAIEVIFSRQVTFRRLVFFLVQVSVVYVQMKFVPR
jgi:hypothetical protein